MTAQSTGHAHGGPVAQGGDPTQVAKDANAVGGAAGGAVGGAAQVSPDMASTLAKLSDILTRLKAILDSSSAPKGGPMAGCDMPGSTPPTAPDVLATQQAATMQYAAAPVAAPALGGGSEDASYEQQVLDLVNAERAKHGLGALRYNASLDKASEEHNAFQAQQRTMAHIDIGDGDPGERIRRAGFSGAWGENVAVGQRTPAQVVAEWMASPTHRANILNQNFTQIGVSYTTTSDGFPFWAQSFGA